MMKEDKTAQQIPAEKFKPVARKDSDEIEKIVGTSLTYVQDSWRRLKKNKIAMLSLILLLLIVLLAIFAPFFAPYHYAQQNPRFANLPPKIPGLEGVSLFNGMGRVGGNLVARYAAANVPSDQYYYLGTDALGRDLLS